MTRDEAIRLSRAGEPELRARGVSRLALFGSLARGEARDDSDVDVVLDIEPGRKFSLIDLAGVYAVLRDLLGRESDVVIREDLRPGFRARLERNAFPVFRWRIVSPLATV